VPDEPIPSLSQRNKSGITPRLSPECGAKKLLGRSRDQDDQASTRLVIRQSHLGPFSHPEIPSCFTVTDAGSNSYDL